MPTVLQLQKKKAEAAAAVDSARTALAAAKTDAEIAKANIALMTALASKVEANEAMMALDGASAGVTTVKHIKHEEKVTERQEEEGEEQERDRAPMRMADPPKDDEKSETDIEDDEEEEESRSIAREYEKASAAVRGKSLAAGLYTPSRLLRAVKKATGAKTLKGAFGALASMGERIAKVEKTEKRIAALEAENTASKVEKLITRAKKDGKIVGKAHEDDMRAQGVAQGPAWLEGRIANMPRVAQTTETGGFVAAEGNTNGTAGALSKDQEKMVAAFTAGMSAEQKTAFLASMANINNGVKAPQV